MTLTMVAPVNPNRYGSARSHPSGAIQHYSLPVVLSRPTVPIESHHIAFLRSKRCPVDILSQAWNSRRFEAMASVMANRHAPSDVLTRVLDQYQSGIWEWDGTCINGSSQHRLPGQPRHRVLIRELRALLGFNPGAAPGLLRRLAADPDSVIRAAVGSNPHTPGDVLVMLVQDSNASVANHAVQNVGCPREAFEAAARRKQQWIKRSLVANPHCPVDVLHMFVSDTNPVVRRSLAKNLTTPGQLLGQLAHDPEEQIRVYVASHRHVDSAVLVEMLQDDSRRVRNAVLSNPHTPDYLRIIGVLGR